SAYRALRDRALHSCPPRRSSDLHLPLVGAEREHRLHGEGHARLDDRVEPRLAVVRDDQPGVKRLPNAVPGEVTDDAVAESLGVRSEEHTSELQSRENLVCRLLLE